MSLDPEKGLALDLFHYREIAHLFILRDAEMSKVTQNYYQTLPHPLLQLNLPANDLFTGSPMMSRIFRWNWQNLLFLCACILVCGNHLEYLSVPHILHLLFQTFSSFCFCPLGSNLYGLPPLSPCLWKSQLDFLLQGLFCEQVITPVQQPSLPARYSYSSGF